MKPSGKLMCFVLVCLLCPTTIFGAEKAKVKEQAIPEVVVESERLVTEQGKVTIRPEGLPAEVNVITKEELERMPYTNSTDILRTIPGVTVLQTGRWDIGWDMGMRGFAGLHGKETAIYIDGVPMNLFNGLGTYGAEIGWLIPEMIERIEVIKGPFSALYGNGALAGVISITTKKREKSPSLAFYGGTYGTYRGVATISKDSWEPTPFLVYEGYNVDGYRNNSDYQRGNFFNKLTLPLWQGDLSFRVHYAARRWGIAQWLDIDQVKAGKRRRDAVNETDRADAEILDFVLNYSPKEGEQGFYGTLYFTHFFQNAINTWLSSGSQSKWHEGRNYGGGRFLYNYMPWDTLSIVVGNETRYDDLNYVSLGLAGDGKTVTGVSSDYYVRFFNTAFFSQVQYKPIKYFKLVGGLRYDIFHIDVFNYKVPVNSGLNKSDFLSPKIGFVITPYKDINIFANKGTGFRSPSCRELSPTSGSPNFELKPSELNSWDVGFNALLFKRLYLAFSYYNTTLEREMIYNPITITYDNYGKSKRTGFEIEARIFITKELTLFGSYADVRARLKNPTTPGAYYITWLPPNNSKVGFEYIKSFTPDQQLGLYFYYQRYARTPQSTDGTKIRPQVDRFFGKVSYRWKQWTATLDAVLNARRYSSEDTYYSGGRVYFEPFPRWNILAGLRYQFK